MIRSTVRRRTAAAATSGRFALRVRPEALRSDSRSGSRGALPICLLLSAFLWPGEISGQPREQHSDSRVARAQRITAGTPEHNDILRLSRAVRPREFLSAVGKRAGVFGREDGDFEAWVYPLKILRKFNLTFHVAGLAIPSGSLARTVTVQPESSTIIYAGDSFSVRETLFVPVEESGAIVALDIETADSLVVEVSFERDFQLMWPAELGGTDLNWNGNLRAFEFGEEQRRFFALVGSPSATEFRAEHQNNDGSSRQSSFRLAAVERGRQQILCVIAGSVESQSAAEKTYRALAADFDRLHQEAVRNYRDRLEQTIGLDLPEPALQHAYDWARVSVLQGEVNNPFLGTGLIAGYGLSGDGTRPGFAWFFGRDALWTAFALNAAGDFSSVRMALEFLVRHQRADGKLPHEVSQSAGFVPWFEDYSYAYASADATPLFILAVDDYVRRSGDVAFAQENWSSLWKAHEFLRSTGDPRGFAQNQGVGHGWVEGGPLLPVKTELYQSGLSVAAVQALAHLARITGRKKTRSELEQQFVRQKTLLNQAFWLPEKRIFAFALDKDDHPVDEASVLTTVPMWFDVLDGAKADAMISALADPNHAADWGMRIISSESAKYHPAGYHFGSVWPLFTGWAAVGMYRQHRSFPAYANLRANADLALDGALGHVTEVLSGSSYAPLSTSSPHQIWSAAMVISPLLRGLLGLEPDTPAKQLRFTPHPPAHWESFAVENLRVGRTKVNLSYRRTADAISVELQRAGEGDLTLEFSPAVSLRAEIQGVEVNDRPVAFERQAHAGDQHVVVRLPIDGGITRVEIHLRDDFRLHNPVSLPQLGGSSHNLKLLSRSWSVNRDRLEIEIAGLSGNEYELPVWGSHISLVEGAELIARSEGGHSLRVVFPIRPTSTYERRKIILGFSAPAADGRRDHSSTIDADTGDDS